MTVTSAAMQWIYYRREVLDPDFDHPVAEGKIREILLAQLTPVDMREQATTYTWDSTDEQGRNEPYDPLVGLPDWAVGVRVTVHTEFEPIPPVEPGPVATEVPA